MQAYADCLVAAAQAAEDERNKLIEMAQTAMNERNALVEKWNAEAGDFRARLSD